MNDSQGHLKTPTPYSDKSDIPFGVMEDAIAIPAPGKTTGEFERVYRSWNIINDFPSNPLAVCARELANAYESDIAAKDKRIAELTPKASDSREFERVACEDPVSACVGYNLPKLMEKADGEYLLFVQTAHNNHKKDLIAAHKTDFRMNVTLIKLLERQVENAGKRIAELEAELSDLREDADDLRVLTERLVHEPCEDAVHCSCVPLLRKKVKELESQMPKVVVPTEHDRKRGTAYCACEAMIAEWDKYCSECGAQLNWTEEAK